MREQSEKPGLPPELSVVMPVHNALPFLDEAVESILVQTFADFEFVILDDASTDGSTEKLREWTTADARIRLIEEPRKLGPVGSSQAVAKAARAPLVARMDADDVSHPERLAMQRQVLLDGPQVGLVGCLSELIDSRGIKVRSADYARLARQSGAVPFAHGAIMYRKELFDRVGGYRDECVFWEDQDFIRRIAELSEVVTIPAPLYSVRQTSSSTRAASEREKLEDGMDRAYRAINGLGPGTGKVHPTTFIALGSVALWSGGHPKLWRRCLERAELGFNRQSAAALAWTGWASLSPGSLRGALRLLLKFRNARTFGSIGATKAVPWKPPKG